MALDLSSNQTNTLERLKLITQASIIKPTLHADLRSASLEHINLTVVRMSTCYGS